jgi:DNA-binding SARP family transcriptional activator
MRYSILGPLQIRADETDVTVPAARERILLAMLLLHANQLVPVQLLIMALWDVEPPSTARAQVHSCVSRLRRLLRQIGVAEDVIVTEPAGYRIRIDAGDLDVTLFSARIERGRAAAANGDLEAAREALRSALVLWRGRPLTDVDSDVVRAAAAHLEEQWNAAFEQCIDIELRMGLAEGVLAELTDLVEHFPHNERLRGHLMTALVRSGRRADALAVYRRGRALLAEELGIEPGAELEALHRRILTGDVHLVLAQSTQPALRRPARCLPRDTTDFAGRADVVERLTCTIARSGAGESGAGGTVPVILAIDGMAGMGKTALAVRVAHQVAERYPDAHLFLDLHGHSDRAPSDPASALSTLLRQLGVAPERIPEGLDDRIVLWRTELAERRALIVLDNALDTAQVLPLLPGASTSCTLITSRRRLAGLDGVHPLSLDVLDLDDAVELLRRMVGDRVRADLPSTVEVAELCGRLPLALRLAAARLQHRPTWTVADLAGRLRDAERRLAELAVDGRTVAAAFTLSYQHLPVRAQQVFRSLGLHPAADFEAHAVAALVDLPPAETTAMLEELVDAHLVEAPAAGRYRLHDLLREYANRLVSSDADRGFVEAAQRRLVAHYLQSTANATRYLEGPETRGILAVERPAPSARNFADVATAQSWLNLEIANILAIAHLADELGWHRELCLLSRAMWAFLYLTGYTVTSLGVCERALAAAAALGDVELQAVSHNYLASAHFRVGRSGEALKHVTATLEMAEKEGFQRLEVTAYSNIAVVLGKLGRYGDCIEHCVRGLALAEERGYESLEFKLRNTLGQTYMLAGRAAEALVEHRRSLAVAVRGGVEREIALSLGEIGRVHLDLGHPKVGIAVLRRALELKRRSSNRYGAAETLSKLGAAYRMQGRFSDATTCQRAALQQLTDVADLAGQCLVRNDLGVTLLAMGAADEAFALHRDALGQAERIADPYEQGRSLAGMAMTAAVPDEARGYRERAVAMFASLGAPFPFSLSTSPRGA